MTFLQGLTTLFEVIMVLCLLWCFFHEDRLITFEKRLIAGLRRRKLKVHKSTYQKAHIVR